MTSWILSSSVCPHSTCATWRTFDSAGLARQAGLPLLILQGEADFQVSMERDFEGWKEALGDLDGKVTYRSYPGLNHLFMKSGGEHAGTVAEYNEPGQVEGQVVEDIANWILARRL